LPSSRRTTDPRRKMFLSLSGQIEGQLRDAYDRKFKAGAVTQSSLAAKLGVGRSAVHRRLMGHVNMTEKTIADMVWALDHQIKVEIFDPSLVHGLNHAVSASAPRPPQPAPPAPRPEPTPSSLTPSRDPDFLKSLLEQAGAPSGPAPVPAPAPAPPSGSIAMRQASVITCEDVTYTLSGKMNIQGMFTSDIGIPFEPFIANQIVFLFLVETSPDDPFETLELSVELPVSQQSLRHPVNIPSLRLSAGDSFRWSLKAPLLLSTAILHAGPIIAKVIHEKGEIRAAAPFIVLNKPTTASTPSSSS
jgi:hypothetical protein